MTDGLTEIGRLYRMEINLEIARAMRISRHAAQIRIGQRQLENVEYYNYYG
jgi:hypothetical protein